MKNLGAILVLAVILYFADLFKTEQEILIDKESISQSGKIIMLTNERNLLEHQFENKNKKNQAEINHLKNK